MVHSKVQNLPRHRIATFRYATDTMFACRVMATRCQAEVIRKAIAIVFFAIYPMLVMCSQE